MSSILFELNQEGGFVAVDTLVTDELGTPLGFTSKAMAVPHLNMVVAVTGYFHYLLPFIEQLLTRRLRGPEDVALQAPEILQGIRSNNWATFRDGASEPNEARTSTVYHFGFSIETGDMVGYQHHSGHDFRAERFPDNKYGGKPGMVEIGEPREGLAEIYRCVLGQQASQMPIPFEERLHIGGEVLLIELTKAGIRSMLLGPLAGYEEARSKIFDVRLPTHPPKHQDE